jgi:hypothetical protein
MGFSLQGFGPFLHWLTLGVLCVLPLLGAFVLYRLGGLPGTIARARSHPQAEAINVCGWMGVITIVLWPIAMVWAYLRPGTSALVEGLSQNNADTLIGKLQQASRRIETLEGRLPTK